MVPVNREIPLPDFATMRAELLRHKHLTLELLWQEYKRTYPDGYQYSWFCELYGRWAHKLDIVLAPGTPSRREDVRGPCRSHRAGCGQGHWCLLRRLRFLLPSLAPATIRFAKPSGNATCPRGSVLTPGRWSFFRESTAVTTPDNWKTGIKDPCYYDPDLNPTYRDWAEHYGTVIIPARVRKPRDKAKVEVGVLIVERWILAALRHRTFFSLAELNGAIRELLIKLNQRKFRKLDTTRASCLRKLIAPLSNRCRPPL